MKSFLTVLMLCIVWAHGEAQSCCCVSTGNNWSILPNLNQQVVGLRYSYRSFYSVYPESLNPEMSGVRTDEQLHTVELVGRFYVHPRLMLSTFVPVNIISRKIGDSQSQTSSLGDMSLMLQYLVLNPERCSGKNSSHQLRLGAGMKLPSGQFEMQPDYAFQTAAQSGTGSIDFLFNAIYTYRFKNVGFNLLTSYKWNTSNPLQYRFGDRLQAGGNAFYIGKIKEVTLMPTAGISYEYAFYNMRNKNKLEYTGGSFLNASVGLDVYYKRFAFSSVFTPALMNKLNWSGEMRNRLAVEAGVYYSFSLTSSKSLKKQL